MAINDRLLEEAADELGRLETVVALAPTSLATALRLTAIERLVALDAPGPIAGCFAPLAAAEGDPLHDTLLPPGALHWRALVQTEERRVRGGAPLASQRFAIVAPTLSTYTNRPKLEAIWRESGVSRPVLVRALDAAAWSPSPALGEACAALLLCAGGRTDHVRVLPFGDADQVLRADAIAAWRGGDDAAWTRLGLGAVARRARAARLAVERVVRTLGDEEGLLDPLGRASITARRAVATLRARFVTTMPSLAEALELSRPAASDALERLVSVGIAREMTGRARDRVYAWGAACALAAAPTVP